MQGGNDSFCNYIPDSHTNWMYVMYIRYSLTNISQRARVILFSFNEVYKILQVFGVFTEVIEDSELVGRDGV